MKRLCTFLSIVLITVIPEVSAQLSSSHHAIRTGDKIIKQQLPFVAPGEAGEGRLWDFSRLPESSQEYPIEYTAPGLWRDSIYIMGLDTFPKEAIRPGELITAMEFYTAYYYRQTDSALFLLGYENPSTLVHYDRPLCHYDRANV